jgi:hypothetical protein
MWGVPRATMTMTDQPGHPLPAVDRAVLLCTAVLRPVADCCVRADRLPHGMPGRSPEGGTTDGWRR